MNTPPLAIRYNAEFGITQPSRRHVNDWSTNRTTFPPNDPRARLWGTPRKESMLMLATDTPPGAFVELGVYRGGTATRLAMLAAIQGRECHLFDSFRGVPEHTFGLDITPMGQFADTDLGTIRRMIPTATIHPGVFPHTMPRQLSAVAFVHVDFENYRSNRAAIDRFYPLLVNNGVMLIDDYNVTPGAKRAANEMFGSTLSFTREGKAYVKKNSTV